MHSVEQTTCRLQARKTHLTIFSQSESYLLSLLSRVASAPLLLGLSLCHSQHSCKHTSHMAFIYSFHEEPIYKLEQTCMYKYFALTGQLQFILVHGREQCSWPAYISNAIRVLLALLLLQNFSSPHLWFESILCCRDDQVSHMPLT